MAIIFFVSKTLTAESCSRPDILRMLWSMCPQPSRGGAIAVDASVGEWKPPVALQYGMSRAVNYTADTEDFSRRAGAGGRPS
jgi:hypothetical protein